MKYEKTQKKIKGETKEQVNYGKIDFGKIGYGRKSKQRAQKVVAER